MMEAEQIAKAVERLRERIAMREAGVQHEKRHTERSAKKFDVERARTFATIPDITLSEAMAISAHITDLEAQLAARDAALREIAETDLLEVTGYHTHKWCVPETGSEYESRQPIFKRSAHADAQRFQEIARAAIERKPHDH